MPRSFEGDQSAGGLRIALIASRFNDEIVEGLLSGAIECLTKHGAADESISVIRVPGAFEIPAVARGLIKEFDAIVALGCILRGETPHFEFIAGTVATELARISTDVPVAFGILTCDTMEQALARSRPGAGNKGWEAALAAIEMVNLWRVLRSRDW